MRGGVRGGVVLAVVLVLLPAAAASAVVVPPSGEAVDDTLVTDEGVAKVIEVTSNDDVPNGFEIAVAANPAHGQVLPVRPFPGWFQYVPAAGYSGGDSFRYRLDFDDGSSSVATVRITVVPVRKPTTTATTTTTPRRTTTTTPRATTSTSTTTRRPAAPTTTSTTSTTSTTTTTTTTTVRTTTTTGRSTTGPTPPAAGPQAVDDESEADFGTPVAVRVLANDRGALVPASVAVVRPPGHGTATVRADGTVTYRSTEDTAVFSDSFGYQVADTAGRFARATVTVRLREPDDLLHGDTSAVPGGTLRLDGEGCGVGEPVPVDIDGTRVADAVAGADGTFRLALAAPDRLGRYLVRAVCAGHTRQSWLDVAQTTTERAAATPAAVAALTAVGAALAFWLLSGFALGVPAGRAGERRHPR